MADTTFKNILPATKAVDNGDSTYSLAAQIVVVPAGGTDLILATFDGDLPVKAIDLGDGTYALAVEVQ
jgi:hypothetical protein